MRYYAFFDDGMIITDDYSHDEVEKGIHIDNIIKNLIDCNINTKTFELFDQNHKKIQEISIAQ